jgi:NADH-quinone oxidoreductase subunit A
LFRQLGVYGFVEMLIFMGVLLVGFVYVWKKGALQWD